MVMSERFSYQMKVAYRVIEMTMVESAKRELLYWHGYGKSSAPFLSGIRAEYQPQRLFAVKARPIGRHQNVMTGYELSKVPS